MLSKKTRLKLNKGWTSFQKYEKNKPQSMHRLRVQVNDTFKDLILLANKIPSDQQSQYFTPQIIEEFLHSLLQFESFKKIDARRARLAATCAKVGLEYCKLHGSIFYQGTVFNEILGKELGKCQVFCADIAYNLELQEKNASSK